MARVEIAAATAWAFLILSPAAAWAGSGGTPVPEPADFALFAAGIIGLIIGRRTSRARRPDDQA